MQLFRLIFLLNVILVTNCNSNVTLLAEEIGDSMNFTCLLEGSSLKSAVTWNTPLEKHADFKASRYLPDSEILCNYRDREKDTKCVPHDWSVNQAIDFTFKPITDYRWESFPIVTSSKSERKQLCEFSKNTFSITLSLRIKHNASIYLCNSRNESLELQSDCYVVSISKTKISLKDQEKHLNSTTINELKEDEWTNLIIRSTQRKVLILKITNSNIAWTAEHILDIKYLSVESEALSLWKVHAYRFLSTNKTMKPSQIGPTMSVLSQPLCISFYVALCSTCVMEITLDSSSYEEIYPKKVENTYTNETSGGTYSWKEIKIISKVSENSKVYLYLSLNNTNGSSEGFWAVDNLRLCNANEIRISNLVVNKNIAKNITCQPFLGSSVSISKPISINGCVEESKIGTHCNITCASIFGSKRQWCERNMICKRKDTSNDCHCALGYQGDTCKDECNKGTWGVGCSNRCGICKNENCNSITGSCKDGCDDGFSPPNCTVPTSVNKTRTTNATSNSITIEWDSPAPLSSLKFTYDVTYKHKKYTYCKNNQQNATTFEIISTDKRKAVADNLLPYSEYYFTVAAIFNGTRGTITNYTASTTYTDTPGDEEFPINIAASEYQDGKFPSILLEEPRCSNVKGPLTYEAKFNCSDDWCDKSAIVVKIPYTNNVDNEKVFEQAVATLIPYSNYKVAVTSKRNDKNYNKRIMVHTKFKTSVGKPPAVSNLTSYSHNESTIWLRWKAPYPPHGQLERYKVECIGINSSHRVYVIPTQCELWDNFTCADVTKLNKNVNYTVRVQARNSGIGDFGKEYSIYHILTQEKESEPPLNVKTTWDKDTAILQWDHPSITNGPLVYFSIEINVVQSEHSNSTRFYSNFTIVNYNRTYYKMLDVQYSTEYNVTVYPINKFKGKPSKTVAIRMPPPTPKLLYTPTLSCFDLKCVLKIPKPVNMSNLSYLYVIVDSNVAVEAEENSDTKELLTKIAKSDRGKTGWLAIAIPVTNATDDFIKVNLGDGKNTDSMYGMAVNKPLRNDTDHLITVIIANYFLNKTRFSPRYNIHSDVNERTKTMPMEVNTSNVALYALFLLLLIPIAICGWILYNRKNRDDKTHTSKWLPNCFQGSSDSSEHLPLHTVQKYKQPAELSKPIGIVKPKSLVMVDAESPLMSQEYSENIQFTYEVKLKDFEEYVKQSIGTNGDGELDRQHNLFVRGQTKPWDYGLKKQNKYKNRYNNLIAYDHSRVKLEKINNDEYSDYINANYINGYKQPKAYIATQGPKPTTLCDFWRMIWQECVTTIVMVANVEEDGKRKTEEYWPKLNCSLAFGSIEVYHQKSEIFSNYVFRTLTVAKDSEERTIEQLHFTSWPDHGVPVYPQTLVPFVAKLRTMPQDIAPIVVHCSAGVGRTGTIILCDYVLRMAEGEDAVDFLATLQELREQRANLVDSPNQYKLAHLVVLETLFGLDTTIPCNYELEQKIDALTTSDGLYKQMEYLEKIVWQDQTMCSSYTSIPDPANKHKNRFSAIVPNGYGRVYISRYPVTDEHSDYINAVEVDGFDAPKRFIVTQQPLPTTVTDFWRMVSEKDVTTIVSLNDINPCDQSSYTFWPAEDELLDLEFATINYVDKDEYVTHDNLKLTLFHKTEEQINEYGININIIKMKGWPPLKTIPENLDSLMATWDETDRVSRGSNPIVVTCYDGAKASGVFVALSFIIEKIKLEQVCDVCLAVRTIRRSREEFVTSVEQFELLYKAAVRYLKSFETYSNFPITAK